MEFVKQKEPSHIIEGEMQIDAVLISSVAERKSFDLSVIGKEKVPIFLDLNFGNFAYKHTQCLAKVEAYGSIYQVMNKSCSDLSDGCKAWEEYL